MRSKSLARACLAFTCIAVPCVAAESPPGASAPPPASPATAALAPAPPQPVTPTLADLLREADENNPAVRAAAARVEAARSLPTRAEAAPDPEVGLTYINDGTSSFTLGESEFSSLGLTWSQEHPYPGKLKRAGAVAGADVDLAAARERRGRPAAPGARAPAAPAPLQGR